MEDWQVEHLVSLRPDVYDHGIAVENEFWVGQQVRVTSGVLHGLVGTVVVVDPGGRAVVSLPAATSPVRVEIDCERIQPVP